MIPEDYVLALSLRLSNKTIMDYL